MNITLDRHQRDALHAACLLDLSGVDEIELYLRQGDFDEARAITDRIAGTAELLDDLGWDPHNTAQRFVLHADGLRLREVIERLRRQAEDSLRDQAAWITAEGAFAPGSMAAGDSPRGWWREEDQQAVDEDLDTRLICDHVLGQLDRDAPALACGAPD